MAPAVLGVVMGAFLLGGCGTGQGSAGNFNELEKNFISGCEATLADDVEAAEAGDGAEPAAVPDDFCQCAFDELSDGENAIEFGELMDINNDLVEEPAALPEKVTEAFASCTTLG